MARDFLYSALLHAGVIALTFLASPFDIKGRDSYDDVIHVSLYEAPPPAAAPVPTVAAPQPTTPATPPPVEEEEPDIPVGEPETQDETVIEEEEQPPVEEPLPAPQQIVVQQPDQAVTSSSAGSDDQAPIHSTVTGDGAVFAGATIDNASFDYPYWFTQAFNKILRNWRNPVSADGVIVCAIYFQVIKSGRVIEAHVKTSSGLRTFDEACLLAVQRSEPFPPLPRQFADEIIGITLPFKYEPGR